MDVAGYRIISKHNKNKKRDRVMFIWKEFHEAISINWQPNCQFHKLCKISEYFVINFMHQILILV